MNEPTAPILFTPYAAEYRVRHYECDSYGHVNNANYLRYMEQTAFDASAAAGYDAARYEALNTVWLIRASHVEYRAGLRYGDRFSIATWTVPSGRFRMRRHYRFTRAGETVAEGWSDWVYLDRGTHRPVAFDDALLRAFTATTPPDAAAQAAAARLRFPEPPAPPPGAFTMTRQVEWRDLDTAQHVNNAVYLHYTEECAIRAAVARGWPPGRMLREGFAIVAREQTIEYTGQARLGDVLRVTTYLADVRRISAVRHFSIVREDGTPIARARGLFLFADLAKGAIVRVPAHFAADFADQVAQA